MTVPFISNSPYEDIKLYNYFFDNCFESNFLQALYYGYEYDEKKQIYHLINTPTKYNKININDHFIRNSIVNVQQLNIQDETTKEYIRDILTHFFETKEIQILLREYERKKNEISVDHLNFMIKEEKEKDINIKDEKEKKLINYQEKIKYKNFSDYSEKYVNDPEIIIIEEKENKLKETFKELKQKLKELFEVFFVKLSKNLLENLYTIKSLEKLNKNIYLNEYNNPDIDIDEEEIKGGKKLRKTIKRTNKNKRKRKTKKRKSRKHLKRYK